MIATGVRERPRAARLIPGDRPAGVITTGALQQLVRAKLPVGRRAVIVGAEHVSFSAVMTLARAGCSTAAVVTDLARHQTYAALVWATTGRRRIPIIAGVTVAEVVGQRRVEAVVLSNGQRIVCDTVVFTADWIPDHELARSAGLTIAPASRAISVSSGLHTSRSGISRRATCSTAPKPPMSAPSTAVTRPARSCAGSAEHHGPSGRSR